MRTKHPVTVPTTILLALLILFSGMGLAVDMVSAEEEEDIDEEATNPNFTELEITEEHVDWVLGGGDFIGLHNKDNDAMIGLLYGTEKNPNNIYIVSILTRYLGTADVYDEDGNKLVSDKAIPVRTLYAQRFDTLYEFDDVDADGVWDTRRMAGENGNGSEEVSLREPVHKKAPLRTAWTPSDREKIEHGNGSWEWTVKLTAENLKYKSPIFGLWKDRNNRLDKVELTFHLYADVVNLTKSDIPVYRVEVEGDSGSGYEISNSELIETRTYSGASISAHAKYDHYFEGWDFSEGNGNPSLLMSTEVIFLNAMNPTASEWFGKQYCDDFQNGKGSANFETDDGEEIIDEDDAVEYEGGDSVISEGVDKPRLIRKNRLGFSDNWQRIGWLRWVSNVTVDGEEDEMFFQIYLAKRFMRVNAHGAMFSGFGLVGGFSYPGGERIFHDPSFEVSSFVIDVGDDEERPLILRRIIVGGSIVVGVAVVVVIVISAMVRTRRRDNIDDPRADDASGSYHDTYYMDTPKKKNY